VERQKAALISLVDPLGGVHPVVAALQAWGLQAWGLPERCALWRRQRIAATVESLTRWEE
jgi:hypothetical protein